MTQAHTTPQQQVGQTLRESEECFQSLAENLNIVLWMRDIETDRIVYVSPAYEKIWGRTRESLYESSQSFVEAIHSEDRERVSQICWRTSRATLTKSIG